MRLQQLVLLLFVLSFEYYSIAQTTTISINSDKSAHTTSDSPTTNFGSVSSLWAGRMPPRLMGGSYSTRRTYVEFDLSSIPQNAIIISASLELHEIITYGTPEIFTHRVEQSWAENSITWSSAPSYSTTDEIEASSVVSGWFTVDVKEHVQNMVAGVYTNFGWVLRHDDELENAEKNKNFTSDDAGSNKPRLIVKYYLPFRLTNAVITHESFDGEDDGGVAPTFTGGPLGTYSYTWIDSSGATVGTSQNLTGVPYGWYGLEVSNDSLEHDFYYAFLVGLNCQEVEIEFQPDSNYIDEALLQLYHNPPPDYSIMNYTGDESIGALEFAALFDVSTLIRFRIWVDGSFSIYNSDLTLSGDLHIYGLRTNEAEFVYVTEDWEEKIVTYSSAPTLSLSEILPIPATTTSSQDLVNFDLISFWEQWQNDNTENYGMLMQLEEYTDVSATQSYFSAHYATASDRPRINFRVAVSNPVPPDYCDQIFAKLDRTLRGVNYKPYLSHLYFFYDEEYETPNTQLNYKVFSDMDPVTPVMDNSVEPINQIEYGDNRYTLDVGDLEVGNYILEVVNNKMEKFYLRFQVEN